MNKETQIVWLPIKKLVPYEHNAKEHTPKQIDNIKKSLTDYGWQNPCLITKDNVLIAGHGRVMAAKELGITEVPCIYADDLTEEQIKEYRHLDNLLSEGGYIDSEMQYELQTVDLSGYDFSEINTEIQGINLPIETDEPGEVVEDDIPEVNEDAEPICKLGDIWVLGNHKLICGDSSKAETFETLMGGVEADFVFTDPPYGVAIGTKNKTLNEFQRSGRCTEDIKGDTLSEQELYEMLKQAFINVRNSCKDDASYYVTSPQGGSLGLMMMMMRDAGLEVRHVLMWEKNSATFSLGRLDYDYQHEPIFYTWTKSHHNYRKGEMRTTIWRYDKPRKCDLHPTMKPIELIANALMDGTQEGMVCIDAFGGSGSTLIACEQLNRKCYMVELDPKYCDVIIQRWENFTGQKAVLINE